MTRDDPAAFAPPPAFGPFRVLHQIGIGALGPVFRTYEPTRDRLVAVKVFRLDITPEQAQALADELARAADAGLFHPSIVEPIAAGVEGTVAYRAEEYVAAESLDVAIRHYAPADLDKALPFLTQLAGAIDFARTAGVGHGGLHLRDIFVTPDEARASGFGIVEALERIGLRAPVRRPYSAPERIAGTSWSTPADVFSLGAIAYELLSGRRPSGTGEQIAALTGENIGVHGPAIRSVLARAMADDPARRYGTALAFASALEGACRGAGGEVAQTAASSPLASRPTEEPRARSLDMPVVPVAAAAANANAADQLRPDALDQPDEEPDIAVERDEDAAHHAWRASEPEDAPGLFDNEDDESVADRALAAGAGSSPWHEDEGAIEGGPDGDQLRPVHSSAARHSPSLMQEDVLPIHHERPRPAMLPVAFGLIVGLLVGFAAGAVWRGSSAPAATVPAAPQAGAASETAAPAPAPPSGRAETEQAVAPPAAGARPAPPGEAPPLPGDGPAAAGSTATRPAPRPAAATLGKLVIRSSPAGAGVTVNGRWRGRTPLTLDALRFGPYAVRIVQSGFAAAREDVLLSAAEPVRTLTVQMQRDTASRTPTGSVARGSSPRASAPAPVAPRRPAEPSVPFVGTIYVDSRPRGARVVLDGRPMGTTPVSIPDIPIGSHAVRLELNDHRAWTDSTRVTAGQTTVVTGSLERIR